MNIKNALCLAGLIIAPAYGMQKFIKPLAACLKQEKRAYWVKNQAIVDFYQEIIKMKPGRAQQRLVHSFINVLSPAEQKDLLYFARSRNTKSITDCFDLTQFFSDKEKDLLTNPAEFGLTNYCRVPEHTHIKNFTFAQHIPLLIIQTNIQTDDENIKSHKFHTVEHHFSQNIEKAIQVYKEQLYYLREPGFEKTFYDHLPRNLPVKVIESLMEGHCFTKISWSENKQYVAIETRHDEIAVCSVPRCKIIDSILRRHIGRK